MKVENKNKNIRNLCVLSTLTYAVQTWAITKQQITRLQIIQLKMERKTFNIRLRDKIKSKDIRITTNRDIGYIPKKLKFKYAGHMMRAKDDRWSYRISVWTPYDRKKKGRNRSEMER